MGHQHQGAVVEGAAALGGGVAQLRQQLAVVGLVVTVGSGIAGGVDPGPPSEGVHRQPRVVGQGRQPGGPGRVAGLDQGVLHERQPGLLGLGDRELGLGAHMPAQRLQQVVKLPELAGVAGGENDLLHGLSVIKVRKNPIFYCARGDPSLPPFP